jgi:hypothetical protein
MASAKTKIGMSGEAFGLRVSRAAAIRPPAEASDPPTSRDAFVAMLSTRFHPLYAEQFLIKLPNLHRTKVLSEFRPLYFSLIMLRGHPPAAHLIFNTAFIFVDLLLYLNIVAYKILNSYINST